MKFYKLVLLLITIVGITGHLNGQTVEETVSFVHGSCNMQAKLLRPAGVNNAKCILIIPGSGQNDTSGTINLSGGNSHCLYPQLAGNELKIYKDLAEGLIKHNYAVFTYNELFVSCPNFSGSLTYDQLWEPLTSALSYLKTRDDIIDTSNFILLGHSEGGSILPHIAKSRSDIMASISVAAAKTPIDTLLADQLLKFAQICNTDTNTAKQQGQQVLSYFSNVRAGNVSGLPDFAGAPPEAWEDYVNVIDSVAENYSMFSNPHLFIGLENDLNVDSNELNGFKNALPSAGYDFWTLEDLNHYMTKNSQPFVSPVVSDTIAFWLRQRIGVQETKTLFHDKINLYPNPSNGQITLLIKQYEEIKPLFMRILDIKGRLVYQMRLQPYQSQQEINLSEIDSGIYQLHLETKSQSLGYKKIVIR